MAKKRSKGIPAKAANLMIAKAVADRPKRLGEVIVQLRSDDAAFSLAAERMFPEGRHWTLPELRSAIAAHLSAERGMSATEIESLTKAQAARLLTDDWRKREIEKAHTNGAHTSRTPAKKITLPKHPDAKDVAAACALRANVGLSTAEVARKKLPNLSEAERRRHVVSVERYHKRLKISQANQ